MSLKLFLDDILQPPDSSWHVVRSFEAFVKWMSENPIPDVISFDHDLSIEHYPIHGETTLQINYSKYKEKTGYDCAQWCVANDRTPAEAVVHSWNPVGAANIIRVLTGMVENLVYRPAQSHGQPTELGV